jgi:DNA-directed RNA polymerase specialized sigma24 family protein
VTLEAGMAVGGQREVDLLALDEALDQLCELDPQQARIVELRFFAGLSIEETSAALGVSPTTVKRDWSLARAWLHRKLKERARVEDSSTSPRSEPRLER